MFRFFVVAFEILALVTVLRMPFVHFWFGDVQTYVADWMLEVSQIAEKKQLADFRDSISGRILNLNEYQQDYLNNITSNKTSMTSFNRMYCESNDKNPYFYGANLRFVCNEISRSGLAKSLKTSLTRESAG